MAAIAQSDWVALARSLRPEIEAAAEQAEAERTTPRKIVDRFREAGLFRLAVPRHYGGEELDTTTIAAMAEEMARADGSISWIFGNGGGGNGMLALFLPETGAEKVFRDPRSIVIGSIIPKGRALPVDGGYMLSGRWPLMSGCRHATWMYGMALVREGDAFRLGPSGNPELVIMFFPSDDGTILDTWDSLGLRGTASHDVEVHDIFVPEDLAFAFTDPPIRCPTPLKGVSPTDAMGGIIGAQCLGIARGAIDAFLEIAGGKRPVFGQSVLRDRGTVQAKVARAEALVRSARLFLFDTYRMRDEWALSGDRTDHERALAQLSVVNAGEAAAEAIDLLYLAAGSSAVYRGSKLERAFRDIHTLTQHMGVSHLGYEQVGRYFLGLGLSPVR